MNREQQDKIWNELSEESRNFIISGYKHTNEFLNMGKAPTNESHILHYGKYQLYEELFGRHNLFQPQIKTWDDFVDNPEYEDIDNYFVELEEFMLDKNVEEKLRRKLLATHQIHQLIEHGYGGVITDNEWQDPNLTKWKIVRSKDGSFNIESGTGYRVDLIAFHEKEQAEKFMLYPSNIRLIEEYNMV